MYINKFINVVFLFLIQYDCSWPYDRKLLWNIVIGQFFLQLDTNYRVSYHGFLFLKLKWYAENNFLIRYHDRIVQITWQGERTANRLLQESNKQWIELKNKLQRTATASFWEVWMNKTYKIEKANLSVSEDGTSDCGPRCEAQFAATNLLVMWFYAGQKQFIIPATPFINQSKQEIK